ncbi:MAG: replication initiator protein [Microviridae sp.]|nr:MAG: replication initiator protein [Microviridae sp.]
MCLFKRRIRNPKYEPNKKNGGIIPPVNDYRTLHVEIDCNECMECRKKKAREWQVRMLEDIKHNKNGKFVTLTLSNEEINKLVKEADIKETGYEKDNKIAKVAVRRFLERWRKKYKKSVRHWLVTELGHKGTENIHLHGIIWTNEKFETIEKIWNYGWIYPRYESERSINFVNEKTVNYIIKYVSKMDEKHKYYKSKVLCSAGIGRDYTTKGDYKNNKFNYEKTEETYRTRTGHKIAMPKYWRNKLYTDEEREILWRIKMDMGVKWVVGEKVKENNEDEYWKLIKWYQQINRELGYRGWRKDVQEETEENRIREIMYERRI